MTIFFHGEDTFTLFEDFQDLKNKFQRQHPGGGLERVEVTAGDTDDDLLRRVRAIFENQGLFANEKFVIIKDFVDAADKYPKTTEYFSAILKSPPKQVEIVILQIQDFDKRKKFYKQVQKTAKVSYYPMPIGEKLVAWIQGWLKKEGYEIIPEASNLLLWRLGAEVDLWQIQSELLKLTQYSTGKTIEVSDIAAVTTKNLTYDVFALTNAVAEGRVKEASVLLETMIYESGSQQKGQIIQIIGALASQIHSLLLMKSVSGEPQEIAKTLGWKEGRVWINLKLAAKFTAQKLKQMLGDLRAIDLRLKTSDEPGKLLLALFIQKVRHAPSPSLERAGGEVRSKSA